MKSLYDVYILLSLASTATVVVSQDAEVLDECKFDVAEDTGEASRCNFDPDVAKFEHQEWKVSSTKNANWLGGPPKDNSETGDGGYAFMETSKLRYRDGLASMTGWLVSQEQPATNSEGVCLTFKYNINGLSAQGLRVIRIPNPSNETEVLGTNIGVGPGRLYAGFDFYPNVTNFIMSLVNRQESVLLWETSDLTFGVWQSGSTSFAVSEKYRIVFEAEAVSRNTADNKGYVAIDDYSLTKGSCLDSCRFDSGFCGWTSDTEMADFEWSLGTGSLKTSTGPIFDQTSFSTGTKEGGGYAFINSNFPNRPGDKAFLLSTPFAITEPDLPKCLSFWVSMYGSGVGDLTVYLVVDGNQTTPIWKMKGFTGSVSSRDSWYRGQLTLSSSVEFQVAFEAVIGEINRGDIAIDTINLADGPCPAHPREASPGGFDCTFIVDMCEWQLGFSVTTGVSLWSRVIGSDYTTSPVGHTSIGMKYDAYMKFETSNFKNREGERSNFTSPPLHKKGLGKSTIVCISFWYYMFAYLLIDSRLGALEIASDMPGVGADLSARRTLWRLNNHQSARWTLGRVSLTIQEHMKLSVIGVRGPTASGVIAIDDITIYDGNCTTMPTAAVTTEYDCWFDGPPNAAGLDSTCNWVSVGTSHPDKKWVTAQGQRRIVGLQDHTFQAESCCYVFLESFNLGISSQLYIHESVAIKPGESYCMSFWVTTFQDDLTAAISVKRRDVGSTVWTKLLELKQQDLLALSNSKISSLSRVLGWSYVQVWLEAKEAKDTQVAIEGVVTRGGFAVDDIKFIQEENPCPIHPRSAAP